MSKKIEQKYPVTLSREGTPMKFHSPGFRLYRKFQTKGKADRERFHRLAMKEKDAEERSSACSTEADFTR